MLENLKRAAWDLIRPIHSPATNALRRRLGRNYFAHPEMELPPPYEAIQLDVERHLHQYLHVSTDDISQFVIVGAHEADEIERLHCTYPQARFMCFEPNPETFKRLARRCERLPFVTISDLALSDTPGKARFYELDMPGTGSLLEPDGESWATFSKWKNKDVTSFEVNVSTLDQETKTMASLDLLWMDVQGAEGRVLKGAAATLQRTKAVFLEVALTQSPYKGALLFEEVASILKSSSFDCVGLGLDAWNGTGNALFIKQFGKLVCT